MLQLRNIMIIIAGLGNPGKKYKNTRHNIGFQVIDEFKEKNNFPKFKLSKKFNSLISEKISKKEKTVLLKPQTFMNESGKAIRKTMDFYKVSPENLYVIHDDIDIILGKVKIVKNRGSAGHKGVDSTIRKIRTKNFTRFRIGIQPKKGKPKNPEKFVLQKFSKEEKKIIERVVKKTSKNIKDLVEVLPKISRS